MKYFPIVSDTAFYTVCGWVLSFCLMRYYSIPAAVALTAAALIAAAIGCAAFLLLRVGKEKKLLGKKEREAMDALRLHLALERPERVRASLLTALIADGKDAHCRQDGLVVDGTEAAALFCMQPLSADAVALLLQRFEGKSFLLFCNELTPQAEKLASDFEVRPVCLGEIYNLFTRTDRMPALIGPKPPAKGIRRKLHIAFSKRNARPFFVSGILLLLMSLFTFFPFYYILSGSLLLCGAVLIRTLGYSA